MKLTTNASKGRLESQSISQSISQSVNWSEVSHLYGISHPYLLGLMLSCRLDCMHVSSLPLSHVSK